MPLVRATLIWAALTAAIAVPLAAAAASPLLAWREPVYIAAGFAGIIALGLLLIQPLLANRLLPGLSPRRSRLLHRWSGAGVLAALLVHVAGLWLTSPPDVIDALLFRSPTPFSAWGVIAMWAAFAAGLVAARRKARAWRKLHLALATVTVAGSIVHALLIEGTMETISKAALCALVAAATLKLVLDTRTRSRPRSR